MDKSSDPRDAKTLEEAARNPDGTWNGARALAWLSACLGGGKGLSEAEVVAEWEKVRQRKAKAKGAKP